MRLRLIHPTGLPTSLSPTSYTPALPSFRWLSQTSLKYLLLPFVIVGRFLFWVLFGIAAWLFIRHLRKKAEGMSRHMDRDAGRDMGRDGGRDAPRNMPAVERMLACDHCGLCLPESEGVRGEGGFYCCEEHRRAGR